MHACVLTQSCKAHLWSHQLVDSLRRHKLARARAPWTNFNPAAHEFSALRRDGGQHRQAVFIKEQARHQWVLSEQLEWRGRQHPDVLFCWHCLGGSKLLDARLEWIGHMCTQNTLHK